MDQSDNQISSRTDEYGNAEKKGIVEKIKEKLPGQHKTATAGTEEQPEKKGVVEQIKEKLPGQHNSTTTTPAAGAAEGYTHSELEQQPEKKGIIEKIKDAVPGKHSTTTTTAPTAGGYTLGTQEDLGTEVPKPTHAPAEEGYTHPIPAPGVGGFTHPAKAAVSDRELEREQQPEKVFEDHDTAPGAEEYMDSGTTVYEQEELHPEKTAVMEEIKETVPRQHHVNTIPAAEMVVDEEQPEKKEIMQKIKESLPGQH